jgi:ferric-dicitrate binding protein FerR (iron transport regulator)
MLYNEDSSGVERLLIKKEQNSISREELAHLDQLLKENPGAKAAAEFYQNGPLQELKSDEAVQALWQELEAKMLHPRRRILSRRTGWLVAASVLIIASVAGFIALKQQPEKTTDNIVLHITGGREVNLSTDQTIKTGTASISATKELMDLSRINGTAEGWNTIEVPQRFDYTLKLSDGSTVKINSATKLKFPFSFTGDKREVYVEGEAYFKIAQKADHPFIVHTSNGDITVLGTEFNVNTYAADVLKTALVKGAVSVSRHNEVIQLKPGDELSWNKNKHTISPLDERATLSWIRGVLYFHNTPLSEIAKMIERWYGIPVEIDDEKLAAEPFTGNLEKYQPLDDFLIPMKGIVKMRCYYKGNVLHMAR